MCIIVVKPENKEFPSYETIKQCWSRNKDGAGYMFPYDNKVIIRKGFMHFGDFVESLIDDINIFGNKIPYVMHFRITTQGGVQQALTHPFPLSRDMDDLKLLQCKSDIGIAHNGVISLTKDATVTDHSDTMEFITEYVSRIIKKSDWYKDEDTKTLLKNLCKSKLCILDGSGHIETIGDGFIEDDGLIYSNTSYKKETVSYYEPVKSYYTPPCKKVTNNISVIKDYEKIRTKFENCKGSKHRYADDSRYRFIPHYWCPKVTDDCSGYCGNCMFKDYCKKQGG